MTECAHEHDIGTAATKAELSACAATPRRRGLLFGGVYIWYVFFAACDVVMTWAILHLRGAELNQIANWVIERFHMAGMAAYKFTLVAIVIVICEIVGRQRRNVGNRLAEWAVAITIIPVVIAAAQLLFALATDHWDWSWEEIEEQRLTMVGY